MGKNKEDLTLLLAVVVLLVLSMLFSK